MARRRQVVWRVAAGLLCLLAGVLVGLACLLLLSGLCLWGLGWLGEQWRLDTANGYYLMYLRCRWAWPCWRCAWPCWRRRWAAAWVRGVGCGGACRGYCRLLRAAAGRVPG